MTDISTFWWERITGPRLLTEAVARNTEKGISPVLLLDHPLPWQEQMQDLIAKHGNARIQTLSLPDELGQDEVIPELITGLRGVSDPICPTEYKFQLNYLRNENILNGTLVWIDLDGQGDCNALLKLVSDYKSRSMESGGAFVITLPADYPLPGSLSSRLQPIRLADLIRPGDALLFANIMADEIQSIAPELKAYAANAAMQLSQGDVEQIPGILRGVNFQEEDPAQAMPRLWREGLLPWPQVEPDQGDLAQRVWKAQLQSAFAPIELERLRLTAKYSAIIENALHTEYWNPLKERIGYVWQKEDNLQKASDVELGTLVWMMALRKNEDRTQFLLYLPEEGLRQWICFLTECRNHLAHHHVVLPQDFCRLLTELAREDEDNRLLAGALPNGIA